MLFRSRPLAVLLPQRSSLLPNVPTAAEAGLPPLKAGTWAGLFAPAKTPPEIVQRMNRELAAAMQRPDVRERITALGFELGGSTPDELGSFVQDQLLAWGKASFKPGGTGWAVLACLLATLCYGIAASFTKRYLTGVNPLATATGSQIGATLGLALPTLWLWPAQMPGPRAWGAIVALALLCTAIAYILYFRLIESAGPARALAVTFLVPVFALAYGAVALGEAITLWMVGCGLVIVLGTALATGLLRLPGPRV